MAAPLVDRKKCRKTQGVAEPGNTCLTTPGRCESCPDWVKPIPAILKTLPTRFARGEIERFFGLDGKPCWTDYYFTLGRGKPKRYTPEHLYFTHKGIIMGHFAIAEIVQNAGQLPILTNMDGDPSAWQIARDAWVAVCRGPFVRLSGRVYHAGFRGWRYFDMDAYRGTRDAKVRL